MQGSNARGAYTATHYWMHANDMHLFFHDGKTLAGSLPFTNVREELTRSCYHSNADDAYHRQKRRPDTSGRLKPYTRV